MINSSQLSFGFEVPTIEKSSSPTPLFLPVRFKTCPKCGIHKSVSEYYKSSRDGTYIYCKPCTKKYHSKYNDTHKKQQREDYKVNPWPRRVLALNQSARNSGATGVLTYADLQEVLALYSNRCVYCNISLEQGLWFDHIWPLSLIKAKSPGWEFATNTVENLVPACGFCNRAKADKSILIFLGWKNGLLE